MANITSPEAAASTTNHNGFVPLLEQSEGREGSPAGEHGVPANEAGHDILEEIAREEESHDELPDDDELPPVYQFPIIGVVKVRFYYDGIHQPMPFPETDD